MKDYKNPNMFDIQFALEQVNGKNWKKKLKFTGEIDLGEIEGELTLKSNYLDFEEMKGIAYPKIIGAVEETLSLRSFSPIHRMVNCLLEKEKD
tara:strand:+ start:250 stop:528 length:279 start_codon:yes stop_codon:yes gene_type:complete